MCYLIRPHYYEATVSWVCGCAFRDQAIRQLEAKVGVLEKVKESTERRARADMLAERRQVDAHKAEAAKLKVGRPAPSLSTE